MRARTSDRALTTISPRLIKSTVRSTVKQPKEAIPREHTPRRPLKLAVRPDSNMVAVAKPSNGTARTKSLTHLEVDIKVPLSLSCCV